jgi:hypothetical protein
MTVPKNEKAPAPTKVQGAFQNTNQDDSATLNVSSKADLSQSVDKVGNDGPRTWPEIQPLVEVDPEFGTAV